MRIGIDIDGVITNTSVAIKDYVSNCKIKENIKDYMENVMRAEMPTNEIKEFFFYNGIEIFKIASVNENAVEVIQKLYEQGNEIYLITARGEKRFKGSEKMTLDFLGDKNIKYDKIIFNAFDKTNICIENGIDIMIDDSAKHCINRNEKNMNSILFNSNVNKLIDVDIPRVNNWIELNYYIKKVEANKIIKGE